MLGGGARGAERPRGHLQGWLAGSPTRLVQGKSKMVKGKEFELFCPGLFRRGLAAGDVYYCS